MNHFFLYMFLKKSKIILFDEATSALDQKNEEFIRHNLEILAAKKTCLAISHHNSIFTQTDRILVIE